MSWHWSDVTLEYEFHYGVELQAGDVTTYTDGDAVSLYQGTTHDDDNNPDTGRYIAGVLPGFTYTYVVEAVNASGTSRAHGAGEHPDTDCGQAQRGAQLRTRHHQARQRRHDEHPAELGRAAGVHDEQLRRDRRLLHRARPRPGRAHRAGPGLGEPGDGEYRHPHLYGQGSGDAATTDRIMPFGTTWRYRIRAVSGLDATKQSDNSYVDAAIPMPSGVPDLITAEDINYGGSFGTGYGTVSRNNDTWTCATVRWDVPGSGSTDHRILRLGPGVTSWHDPDAIVVSSTVGLLFTSATADITRMTETGATQELPCATRPSRRARRTSTSCRGGTATAGTRKSSMNSMLSAQSPSSTLRRAPTPRRRPPRSRWMRNRLTDKLYAYGLLVQAGQLGEGLHSGECE